MISNQKKMRGSAHENPEISFCGRKCCYSYHKNKKPLNRRLRTIEKRELQREMEDV